MSAAAEVFVKFSADIKSLTGGFAKAAEAADSLGTKIDDTAKGFDIIARSSSAFDTAAMKAKLMGTSFDHTAERVKYAQKAVSDLVDLGLKPGDAAMDRAITKLKSAQDAYEQTARATETAASKTSLFTKALGAVSVAAISAGLAAMAKHAVDLGAELQSNQVAFTTMLGSAQKADKFLRDLATFAANTPFELRGLTDASKRLLAFGFDAKAVIPIMNGIGNAVAAVGGGKDVLDGVTMALGQMAAKGKVSAEEMNQLAERGIPAWKMLADGIGKSVPEAMKMAEKGAIDANTAIVALVNGMNQKFGGMMEKQSKLFNGAMSNLRDSVDMAMTQVGLKLIDTLNLVPIITAMSRAINNLTNAFTSGGLIAALDMAFGPASKAAIIGIGSALALAVIPQIGLATAALTRMAAAAVAAALPYAPLIAAGLAIAAASYVIIKNWDKIKEVFAAVAQVGADAFNWLRNKTVTAFAAIADIAGKAMAWIRDKIVSILGPDLAAKLGVAMSVAGDVFKSFGQTASDTFTWVRTKTSEAASTLAGDFTGAFAQLSSVAKIGTTDLTKSMTGLSTAAIASGGAVAKAHHTAAAAAKAHAAELKETEKNTRKFFDMVTARLFALGDVAREFAVATEKSKALGDAFDLAGAKAEILKDSMPRLRKVFGDHSNVVQQLTADMNAFRAASENGGARAAKAAQLIGDSKKDLEMARREAVALGKAFDEVAEATSRQEQLMKDLVRLGIEPGTKAYDEQVAKLRALQTQQVSSLATNQNVVQSANGLIAAFKGVIESLGTLGNIFGLKMPEWAQKSIDAMMAAATAAVAVIAAVVAVGIAFEALDKQSYLNPTLKTITLIVAALAGAVALAQSLWSYFASEGEKAARNVEEANRAAAQRSIESWQQSVDALKGAFKTGFTDLINKSENWADQIRQNLRNAIISAFIDRTVTEGFLAALTPQFDYIKRLMSEPGLDPRSLMGPLDAFARGVQAKIDAVTPTLKMFGDVLNKALPAPAKVNQSAVDAYMKQLGQINTRMTTLVNAGADKPGSTSYSEYQALLASAAETQQKIRQAQLGGLALGGMVTGPTIAKLGEGGRNEAVLPLNDNVYRQIADGIAGQGGGGMQVVVNYTGNGKWTREDAQGLGRLLVSELRAMGVRA